LPGLEQNKIYEVDSTSHLGPGQLVRAPIMGEGWELLRNTIPHGDQKIVELDHRVFGQTGIWKIGSISHLGPGQLVSAPKMGAAAEFPMVIGRSWSWTTRCLGKMGL
jgi:hypothetical protein